MPDDGAPRENVGLRRIKSTIAGPVGVPSAAMSLACDGAQRLVPHSRELLAAGGITKSPLYACGSEGGGRFAGANLPILI